MRMGTVLVGLVGAVVIGLTFWLALYGLVTLNRPQVGVLPGVGGPGVIVPQPGGAPGTGQPAAPAAAAQELKVKLVAQNIKFQPNEIKAAAGQKIELTLENKDAIEHDFVLDDPKVRVLAPANKTEVGSFTMPKEGTYQFYCSIPGHKEAGMVGKLTVAPGAGGAAQPAAPAQPAAAPAQAAQPQAAQPVEQQPAAAGAQPLPFPKYAAPVNRTAPALVKQEIETREVVAQIDEGVTTTFWTFGGSVPGPMLRVRVGDTVETTLKNAPDSKVTHSIDLHAVTGPGGGAKVTQVAPGQSATFSWKAMNPGVYVYHCATPMVAQHIANGMYGLVVVEPENGFPKVDHEYYVMQGDFYLQGPAGSKGNRTFSVEKMLDERPDYVLFNGGVGMVSKANALKAKVGETVRIFFGVGGPNITSSFHVIGEIFDKVYPEGSQEVQTNIQTTLVPAGGATIVDFKVDVPGTFILVDHSLGRLQKGGAGFLEVEGAANPDVFNPLKAPGPQ